MQVGSDFQPLRADSNRILAIVSAAPHLIIVLSQDYGIKEGRWLRFEKNIIYRKPFLHAQ
jgi:hypothetical protein